MDSIEQSDVERDIRQNVSWDVMTELYVAKSSELEEGERKLIKHGDLEIGVLRANGGIRAILNVCPHQGGPVCEGMMIHRVEEVIGADRAYRGMRFTDDLHLVCPWHGWEFHIETGRCAGDGAHSLRVFPVREREGEIYVVV